MVLPGIEHLVRYAELSVKAHLRNERVLCATLSMVLPYISASGSVGGVRPCQGRGRGFESRLALLLMAGISLIFKGFQPFVFSIN